MHDLPIVLDSVQRDKVFQMSEFDVKVCCLAFFFHGKGITDGFIAEFKDTLYYGLPSEEHIIGKRQG